MLAATMTPRVITTAVRQPSQGLVKNPVSLRVAICVICHEFETIKIRTSLGYVQLAKRKHLQALPARNNGSDRAY
jgi:hypothetical protein